MEEMDTTSAIISEELMLFLEVVQQTHVLVSLTLDPVVIQVDSMVVKKTSACQKEDKETEIEKKSILKRSNQTLKQIHRKCNQGTRLIDTIEMTF